MLNGWACDPVIVSRSGDGRAYVTPASPRDVLSPTNDQNFQMFNCESASQSCSCSCSQLLASVFLKWELYKWKSAGLMDSSQRCTRGTEMR
jgi:hypothetical protein